VSAGNATPRVALVTGGARGIGRQVALDLAGRGWAVALCARTSREAGEATRGDVERLGAPAFFSLADVSRPEECERLVRETRAWRGRIDALVHCAGPYHRRDLFEETPEGWREMFAHNLDSLFFMARAVAPIMIEAAGGRMVAFSMANADRVLAQPMVTAHYLAKVGVLGLVRTLAKMLARHSITVNAVSPGFIDSGSMPEEELKQMARNVPAGYIGTCGDVSSAVLYLLSEEARYVNGANIHVSGGWGL
jgi:3-oxoacyl-[acyl-carrier protein] reductase